MSRPGPDVSVNRRFNWEVGVFYVICRSDWEAEFAAAAVQSGARPVFVRDATLRDIAVLGTVFVDLEHVQQHPFLADWVERAQRTANQSLHIVPYYIEKAPSFGDFESAIGTLGLYQARQWRKSQVLARVSAAMARGRWQISVRNAQRLLSQLISMVEIPCRFYMVAGYLFLPAAWCLLQWFVPPGWVAPTGIAALLTIGLWLDQATRRRRDTALVPRVGGPLERRLPSLFAVAAILLGFYRLGFDVTGVVVLSSWLVAMLLESLGDSLTRLSVCEAWCDQVVDRNLAQAIAENAPARLLKMPHESAAGYQIRKINEQMRLGHLQPGDNELHWPNVFISHRNDVRGNALSDQLYEQLQERGRMKPFLDRVHLREGSWRAVLAESLNRSGVFVCILTGKSDRSWVRRELSCAIRLAVVYGSPLIRVVEADYTLEELDLDEAVRERINLEGLPRWRCEPGNEEQQLRHLAMELEQTLQRRPAVQLVPWLEQAMGWLRLAWLLTLVSGPLFWLFGLWSEQLPGILKMAVCYLLASEFSMLGSWLRLLTYSPAEETRETQVLRHLLLVLYPAVLLAVMHWLAGVNEAGAVSLWTVLIMLVGLVVNLEQRFVLDTRFNDPRRSGRAAPWRVIAGDNDRRLVILADENWTARIGDVCRASGWPYVTLDSLLVLQRGDRLVVQQEWIVSGSLPELLVQQLSQQRIVPAVGLLCFRGTEAGMSGGESESSLKKLRALGVTDAGVLTDATLPSCLERLMSGQF